MTNSNQPEYTSTTKEFRAEDITPFIGQKVVVAITPVPDTGFAPEPTVAAGIIAGAYQDQASQSGLAPLIYFEHGFKIPVNQSRPGTVITIALVVVDGRV
ncbi:hypothetical protein [Curtobacterium sp. VKM Ac-1395]|uniref:hypothetical protein n=1 Tax=Curtobacterium sp. VKM Ac-1395 TaxID=2783815 RepID=UPI00188A6F1E|nr:hypothetical protein [Curtobacterium sp. VKM Ac-1395]MBF4592050.1 hypothetical protein [Curtobacterium sp. VKM Ac-1395]